MCETCSACNKCKSQNKVFSIDDLNNYKVRVLGVGYMISVIDSRDNDNGGEVDLYEKRIKVYSWKDEENVSNKEKIIKHCLRHEIIHAFLFESGLNDNCFNCVDSWAANEEMVDWFAIQYPKIRAVFKELNIED